MKTQKSERVSKSDTLHAHSSDQLRDHFNEETEQIRLFHSREPFSWQRLPIAADVEQEITEHSSKASASLEQHVTIIETNQHRL